MTKRSSNMLFISFWDICLDNLPEGTFRHRRLTADDAKGRIEQARQKNKLLGLTKDDLLAPYRKREHKNHEGLCKVLKKHFEISLSLRDFVSDSNGDGLYFINPLNCVQLQSKDQLLVITCAYGLKKKNKDTLLEYKIEPTTVKFHMIESKEDRK